MIMAKVSAINSFLLLSKRAYTVAAESVRMQSAAVLVMRQVTESSSEVPAGQKDEEVFWMKDPKTGNYMPQNHFNEIDVAVLREEVLLKKGKF